MLQLGYTEIDKGETLKLDPQLRENLHPKLGGVVTHRSVQTKQGCREPACIVRCFHISLQNKSRPTNFLEAPLAGGGATLTSAASISNPGTAR